VLCACVTAWLRYLAIAGMLAGVVECDCVLTPLGRFLTPFVTGPSLVPDLSISRLISAQEGYSALFVLAYRGLAG
jgi:hypothetical protein